MIAAPGWPGRDWGAPCSPTPEGHPYAWGATLLCAVMPKVGVSHVQALGSPVAVGQRCSSMGVWGTACSGAVLWGTAPSCQGFPRASPLPAVQVLGLAPGPGKTAGSLRAGRKGNGREFK